MRLHCTSALSFPLSIKYCFPFRAMFSLLSAECCCCCSQSNATAENCKWKRPRWEKNGQGEREVEPLWWKQRNVSAGRVSTIEGICLNSSICRINRGIIFIQSFSFFSTCAIGKTPCRYDWTVTNREHFSGHSDRSCLSREETLR